MILPHGFRLVFIPAKAVVGMTRFGVVLIASDPRKRGNPVFKG
jgi:hypothetical protein